jgi:hypothetical protein
MKKSIISLAMLSVMSASALASEYVSLDYSDKQKVGLLEHHDVYGVAVGSNLGPVTVEGRLENEVVHDPAKHEGLAQVKATYNIGKWYGVTPYIAGAVGEKDKATINFGYYVVESGLKYSVFQNLDVGVARRLRSPFSESKEHTGPDLYRTYENSAFASFKLDGKNSLTAKIARERGDSNYNTVNVGLKHSF